MHDRAGLEQGLAEPVRRGDVRLGYALQHDDADPKHAKGRPVLGSEHAYLDQLIDDRDRHQDHVGLFALCEPLLQGCDHGKGEGHLVTGPALELRRERGQHLLRCAPAYDAQVR